MRGTTNLDTSFEYICTVGVCCQDCVNCVDSIVVIFILDLGMKMCCFERIGYSRGSTIAFLVVGVDRVNQLPIHYIRY